MFKKVVYNTGAQIIGKAATAGTTLAITLLIGKSLGPSGYGEFTKIFVFVGYFYTIADFGLNSIYIKLSQEEKDGTLIRYLVGVRLIIALALAAAAVLISELLPYDPNSNVGFSPLVKTGIIIASATIVTQALFTSANAFFQKKLRYDLSTIAAVGGTLLVLIVSLLSFAKGGNLLLFSSAYVFGGIGFVLISYSLILKKFGQKLTPLFGIRQFNNLLAHAWPVGLALIFNLIYFRIDVFILSYSRPSSEVGLYGLAYQFFEAALAVPIFFANALYPQLAQLFKENLPLYKIEAKKWFFLLFVFSIALTIALQIAALLIPSIYDERFAGSRTALQVLSLGIPFFFISALLWHLLIIHSLQKKLIYIYASGAVFNFVFNLLLIPKFGFIAASATTVASEALITVLLALSIIKRKQL